MNPMHEANRRGWDAASAGWQATVERDVDWRRCPADPAVALIEEELELLADVAGRDVCVLGSSDNLAVFALAGMAARLTSVDISQAQLDTAASRAGEIGIDIAFLRADAVDLRELGDESFDLVYTGGHVAVWVSDLKRYYAEACRILRRGGMLMVNEYHPFRRIWRASPDRLELACGYFERGPHRHDRSDAVPGAPPGSLPSYEFNWTVAGLRDGADARWLRTRGHPRDRRPARAVGIRAAGGAAERVAAGRPKAVAGPWGRHSPDGYLTSNSLRSQLSPCYWIQEGGSKAVAQKSEIEWTDATWNPVTGCTKVGPGCDNCYAERFAERWRGVSGHPYEQGFDLRAWPSRLEQPMLWKKPRMIFVNSMSDLFHKDIDRRFIDRVFDAMEGADWHVYQVLTKRSSLMRRYIRKRYAGGRVPTHIWLGVSVEDAAHTGRIEHLKQINSDARFVSFEPLLGPILNVDLFGIAWAIVGGESGPRARTMEESWVRVLRDICDRDGAAFFFKQWGGPRPKSGGRLLDGEEWNGFPWQIVPKPILEQISA